MSSARFGQHVPDILDCLAQLSNDEVPTPPKLAIAMLDLLPAEVWSRPHYVWLDPFSKSGVFLREVASRLLEGLAALRPARDREKSRVAAVSSVRSRTQPSTADSSRPTDMPAAPAAIRSSSTTSWASGRPTVLVVAIRVATQAFT